MTAAQTGLVLSFAEALTELVTVEKKNIVALTEIAGDALRVEPASAPALALLITNRVKQAPPLQKLPVLYLLDSISKTVGEPYKTLFAPSLPDVFMDAWSADRNLHRALDKLLNTWTAVYPQPLLADIQARQAAARAAAAPLHVQPPAGHAGYGFAALAPAAAYGLQQPPAAVPGYGLQQQQQQLPGYVLQQPAAQAAYPHPLQPGHNQQPSMPQQQPYGMPQQQPQLNVPDLLSSLMSAGLLAAPGTQPPGLAGAAAQQPQLLLGDGGGGGSPHTTPPYASAAAAAAALEPEQPATTKFSPERLKAPNPSAVARLLRATEATKSRFLDSKFLRRQQKAAGASSRGSRLWYLELGTWSASTVGQAGAAGGAAAAASGKATGQGVGQQGAAAAPVLDPQQYSVPVDDLQTHCALSGEQFEQFWDEAHQEWRYRGAKALDADEAARYGLQEGSIVLVTALGTPDGTPAGGPGVLSELAAQREIADDLAAAAQADAAAGTAGELAAAGGVTIKEERVDLKHPSGDAAALAALAAAEGVTGLPVDKRQRVA